MGHPASKDGATSAENLPERKGMCTVGSKRIKCTLQEGRNLLFFFTVSVFLNSAGGWLVSQVPFEGTHFDRTC